MSWEEVKERLIYAPPKKMEEAVGPVLERIDYAGTQCEDCDKILDCQRVIDISKRTTPFALWTHKCRACGLHQDPRTGKFTLTSQEKATVLATLKREMDK
jgi:hypothetical protein